MDIMKKGLRFKTKTKIIIKAGIFLALVLLAVKSSTPKKLDSATLISVKDTLSSSRLSYVGAVATGNTVGSSLVTIKTSSLPGWATSDDTKNLFTNDTLMIGTRTNYTAIDIYDDDQIQIYHSGGGLQSGDADVDDPIIATRSAQHTVTFTPVTAINNGYYRVRLAATSGTQAQSHDGIPDANGFDFVGNISSGTWPNYITCPDSGTPTIAYSGGTNCPSGYSCVFCNYTGINSLAQKTITVGTTAPTQQVINPAPSSTTKTAGVADTYTFYVDHLDNSYSLIDSTQGKIAIIESVRVTAAVEPRIELTIAGMGVGTSSCGLPASVTTTAVTVPLGSLSITNFTNAAQSLTISTNADGGYAVTTLESDQLSKIIGAGLDTGVFIADTPGDTTTASHTTADEWVSTAVKGFGYSLHNSNAASVAFEYTSTTGGCDGVFCAKQFADNNNEAAQTLFSSTTVANSELAYVCYRAIIGATQEAGTYTNAVTYIASATF